MASLVDFFQPEQPSPAFGIADIGLQRSQALADAGLQLGRNQADFQEDVVPGLRDRFASRGTFHSGILGQAGEEAEQNFLRGQSDIQRELSNVLADLTRQRLFTTLGIQR